MSELYVRMPGDVPLAFTGEPLRSAGAPTAPVVTESGELLIATQNELFGLVPAATAVSVGPGLPAPELPAPRRVDGGAPSLGEILGEALEAARAVVPEALLVKVIGMGLSADGRIDLTLPDDYSRRWEIAFVDETAKPPRYLTVRWPTDAYPGKKPNVDPYAGNVSETPPIELAPDAIPDSVAVAAAFTASTGVALRGQERDMVIYSRENDRDVVCIHLPDGRYWQAAMEDLSDVIDALDD